MKSMAIGRPMLLIGLAVALLALASGRPLGSQPAQTRRRPPLDSDSIRNVDELGWVKLEDLDEQDAAAIRAVAPDLQRRLTEHARSLLASVTDTDIHDYLEAYADYADFVRAGGTTSEYAKKMAISAASRSLTRLLVADKIIRALLFADNEAASDGSAVRKEIYRRRPATALQYVLYAESQFAKLSGIIEARAILKRGVIAFPGSPALADYAAATCMTMSPATMVLNGKAVANKYAVPPAIDDAIQLCTRVLEHFPDWERNYYPLIFDLMQNGRRTEAERVLEIYIRRFGENGRYAKRLRALFEARRG